MYCSQCGNQAEDKFCWNCGAALRAPAPTNANPPAAPPPATVEPAELILELDWADEVRYDVLIAQSEVRDRVARHAKMAKTTMSAEEFLKVCDGLMKLPVSMSGLARIAQPISTRMGIKTGKARSQWLARPCGEVLVAALCSLARQGITMKQVDQERDGCRLQAALPSTLWTQTGEITLSVRRKPPGTFVEAATTIEGQLYDWGSSNAYLNSIFDDLQKVPA